MFGKFHSRKKRYGCRNSGCLLRIRRLERCLLRHIDLPSHYGRGPASHCYIHHKAFPDRLDQREHGCGGARDQRPARNRLPTPASSGILPELFFDGNVGDTRRDRRHRNKFRWMVGPMFREKLLHGHDECGSKRCCFLHWAAHDQCDPLRQRNGSRDEHAPRNQLSVFAMLLGLSTRHNCEPNCIRCPGLRF